MFLISPLEIWQSIISYSCVDAACKNLFVFPMLDKMKENVEESLIMPKVEYNSGIFMTWPIKQDLYSQLQPKHY